MTDPPASDSRLLVVDDEPVNLELLEEILTSAGYTDVSCTSDPRQALARYQELDPDLVLLDLRMPHLDGFQVMGQLRAAQPAGSYLPILVLTAEVSAESKQRALSEGATDFLLKPFDMVEVLLRIANLLETRRLHLQLRQHNQQLEHAVGERTAELERARADLAQIAHAAAHDLVEPVRTVTIYLQLLARRYRDILDGEAGQYLDYIVQGGNRAYDLLGDLLSFAEAAAVRHADVQVDCQAVVEQVLGQLAAPIARAGGVVTVERLPTVSGDPVHLAQIFHHLLDNALKFHDGQAPRVRVWAEEGDGQWCFAVADRGIGISPEQRERIFGLFVRLHHRHDFDGNGTGLGISQRLVEDHGGRIWVEPNPEGGSIFRFTIPA
jgi:signal transduction histidine kinase